MPKKSNRPDTMFPQTPPICWGILHFKFLDKMVLHNEGIGQGKMIRLLKTNKTTLSQIKTDIAKIGWCEDIDNDFGKTLTIRPCKLDEIKTFLGYWHLVKQHFFIRPHNILIRCYFTHKPKNFHAQMEKLSDPFKIVITHMKHNKQYAIKTDYGTIMFRLHGTMIEFYVEGVIMPVQYDNLELLEHYIYDVIKSRFDNMLKILLSACKEKKVILDIDNIYYLKNIHIGILTEKDIAKTLHLIKELENAGLFKDHSIYGCDEWEKKGNFDNVLEHVKAGLRIFMEAKNREG